MALQDTTKTEYLAFLKYALNGSPRCLGLGFIPQFPYTTPPPVFQITLTPYLLNQRALLFEAWIAFPKHIQFPFEALCCDLFLVHFPKATGSRQGLIADKI